MYEVNGDTEPIHSGDIMYTKCLCFDSTMEVVSFWANNITASPIPSHTVCDTAVQGQHRTNS